MKFYIKVTLAIVLAPLLSVFCVKSQNRAYYQEPSWKPRAILSYDDAISGKFWPKSPPVNNTFNDPSFYEPRLSKVPEPGVHPRVLVTPDDVERIRAEVMLGEKAALPFRSMWKRVSRSKSAFYALVAKDDELGKKLADQLVIKLQALDKKLDFMDKQPDSENIWSLERSIVAMGEPDPPTEIWDLLDYDYLYGWMTVEQRKLARKVIARLTTRRISNYLTVPDTYMINNHEGFGMEYIRLMLLIEGEEGFNKELFDLSCKKTNALLDWYLDDAGMCYESIKGWLNTSAITAVGLRQRNLLKHDHLKAKMRFFMAAIRWENGKWMIRDEMRASAFHVIWMMHYYHPTDEVIDFLYQATLSSHDFLTNPDAKWPNPVGICNELLLLWADNGITDKKGKTIDWTQQANINKLKLPLTWQDDERGYVDTRNSWEKDDLHMEFVCKQDFFYGGHEGSENNRLILWKDGVNWIQDNNMLATKATFLQNMMTVDGKGCHWPPAPGTWLGVKESPEGLTAVGDGKDGFSYYKSMQTHPLWFPSAKVPYYAAFTEANFDLTRDIQVAFNPRTIKFNDGFAHTDYGPWSGETRLVEGYRQWNPMQQWYRTVHLSRGNNPYVLVIDDAKKDENTHLFDWNISVPLDVELIDAVTPEIQFQNTEPSDLRLDDIILGKTTTEIDSKTGKHKPLKGDPLCLIRVLWRNTNYGFPVPRFERYQGYNQVVIPAQTVSPDFKILIYPFKFGEPMPETSWNEDRTALTVSFKDRTDVYHFGKTDGGRTVISMFQDNKKVMNSDARPGRPVMCVRGKKFDINDLRYTREENKIPEYMIDSLGEIQFERVKEPSQIRYTLDGSIPDEKSNLYEKPVRISKNSILKAIVYDPKWEFGDKKSMVLEAHFKVCIPEKALNEKPKNAKQGILVRVYEKNTKMFNDKGFFDASKVMMPDLNLEKPVTITTVEDFKLPRVNPIRPLEEQCKGFYRFNGYFFAPQKGVYTFDANSCGPVTFDIDSKTVIEHTGIYHQQQAHRQGEVVLELGWHKFELVICDPLFWNINVLEPMPFDVRYSVNGKDEQQINPFELCFIQEDGMKLTEQPAVKFINPLSGLKAIEPGFDLQIFDRSGKRRDADFLDVEDARPYRSEHASQLESSDSRNTVRVYSGYFHAPETGIYTFSTIGRIGESAGLGAKQASCQNQIRVGNEVVVQRGVYGRNPDGRIGLKEGWYPVSIRFGSSDTHCYVTFPDRQTILLTGENIFSNKHVDININGNKVIQTSKEIFAPAKVALSYIQNSKAEIRYTLDGSVPTNKSQLYKSPFLIDRTTKIITAAFQNGKMVLEPVQKEIVLVKSPVSGFLGKISFDSWDGYNNTLKSDAAFDVWINPCSKLIDSPIGKFVELHQNDTILKTMVDVNVSRGSDRPGFKIYHLKICDNALTVALWFKSDELDGKLFGKDGYNAYGKQYRTVSCRLEKGKFIAMPGKIIAGQTVPGKWQFVVLCACEKEVCLYLNGIKVATAPGSKDITTDALDFFTSHNASVKQVQLFGRALESEEVKSLFQNR